MAVLHIPEENRSVDLLELSEWPDLLCFHQKTLKLYLRMCALGNHRVAHVLCRFVTWFLLSKSHVYLIKFIFSTINQQQFMYIVKASSFVGPLKAAFNNLLIEMHLAPHASARWGVMDWLLLCLINDMSDAKNSIMKFIKCILIHCINYITMCCMMQKQNIKFVN